MSKFDIRSQLECQNRILNVKMRYSVPVRMSNFECQNAIFGPNLNVKTGFRMSKCDIRSEFECRKTKNEKRKTKKRKAKNEKQTNFTFN